MLLFRNDQNICVKLHIKYNRSYILSEIVTSLFLEGNWWATILALTLVKCYWFNLQWTVLRFLVQSKVSKLHVYFVFSFASMTTVFVFLRSAQLKRTHLLLTIRMWSATKAQSLNRKLRLSDVCLYLVREHSMKLLFGQTEAFAVSAVHHQDDNLKD